MKLHYSLFSLLFILFISVPSFAQTVKLQNNFVLLNGKKIMSYEKRYMGNEISLYDMETKEETVFIVYLDKPNIHCDDDERYIRIVFPELNKIIETSRVSFTGPLVKWLIQNEVIDESGKVNPEKVDLFILKYDEHLSW